MGARGFSLIEVMIAVALIGVLAAAGLPSFKEFMQNSKIRSTAGTFYAGVQAARAEAIRRNVAVQFVLTTDDPTDANKNTTNLSTNAANWLVRTADPAIPGAFLYIMGKSAAEGAGGSQTVQVDGGGTTTITFTPFGGTTLAAATTLSFTNPTGGACATAGPMRCMNVAVSVGGQVRMCDPAVTTVGDTRKC